MGLEKNTVSDGNFIFTYTNMSKAGRPALYENKCAEVLALLAKGFTIRAVAHKLNIPKSIVGRMGKK